MKEFLVYTLLRTLLFVAVLAVVIGVWILVFGHHQSIIWPVLVALVVSGVLSLFVLNRPREAFAEKVETRARRATQRMEEMRTKEDED
ncbi:MAG: DUF4229 domain-containing protein [Nocardioidaceae bacterium]